MRILREEEDGTLVYFYPIPTPVIMQDREAVLVRRIRTNYPN